MALAADLRLEASIGTHVWTSDGQRIVFASQAYGEFDLFTRSADGTGTVEQLTTGAETAKPCALARWALCGLSVESDRAERDLRATVPAGERRRVASLTEGGTKPVWARNGRELFYLDLANTLTA